MALAININYRIKRNSEHETQMRYLVNELKVFKSLSSVLVVSAIIGYNNGINYPFEKSAEPVLMQFFTDDNYDIMNLLAYAFQRDQSIFKKMDGNKPNNRQFEIFEKYANAGFPILVEKLGVNFNEKEKNDRRTIIRRYYSMLMSNGFYK